MNRNEYETITTVETDEWKSTGAILVALFIGGGVLLIGMGIWDLFSSEAAQNAFAAAIKSIGYGATALLVLLGLGALAYSASFLLKAMTPMNLSKGVREHGGMFRNDGLVVTLPKDFDRLPEGTQVEILKSLADSGVRLSLASPEWKVEKLHGQEEELQWGRK